MGYNFQPFTIEEVHLSQLGLREPLALTNPHMAVVSFLNILLFSIFVESSIRGYISGSKYLKQVPTLTRISVKDSK